MKTVGAATEMSTTAESTWPWANKVIEHSCSADLASLWISSCRPGQAAIASNSRTSATSNEAITAWPGNLK